MQKSLYLLFLAFLLLNVNCGTTATDQKENIKVEFTNQMEKADLMAIRTKMQGKNIQLDFNELQFDENNKLKEIRFSVDFRDGFKGDNHHVFKNAGETVGFYRDYSKDAEKPFGIGKM